MEERILANAKSKGVLSLSKDPKEKGGKWDIFEGEKILECDKGGMRRFVR